MILDGDENENGRSAGLLGKLSDNPNEGLRAKLQFLGHEGTG